MASVQNPDSIAPIDIAILQCNSLDCDGMASQLHSQREFRVVELSTSIVKFSQTCERLKPRVAIVDASYPRLEGDVYAAGSRWVQLNSDLRILFLDALPNRTRARQAIQIPNAGYVTRQRTFRQLVAAILDLVDGHTPFDGFDAAAIRAGRDSRTPAYPLNSALAQLSGRELDVLQLIAEGMSASECALRLRLSANTVENHKARLMRKLGVKKVSQLTLIAVREGLVIP